MEKNVDERKCLHCEEVLIGRSDKKFCDDQCRSSYNNKSNTNDTSLIRNTNNILRKNRRILQELNPNGKSKVLKDKLLSKGYNFKYHTHTYQTKEQSVYLFCYDYGILSLDNDWFLIVKND